MRKTFFIVWPHLSHTFYYFLFIIPLINRNVSNHFSNMLKNYKILHTKNFRTDKKNIFFKSCTRNWTQDKLQRTHTNSIARFIVEYSNISILFSFLLTSFSFPPSYFFICLIEWDFAVHSFIHSLCWNEKKLLLSYYFETVPRKAFFLLFHFIFFCGPQYTHIGCNIRLRIGRYLSLYRPASFTLTMRWKWIRKIYQLSVYSSFWLQQFPFYHRPKRQT